MGEETKPLSREKADMGIRKDWGGKWMCARCPYKRVEGESISNHLSMANRETQSEYIQCPKCGKICKHAGNLKQHQTQQERTKKRDGQQRNGEESGEIFFRNSIRRLRKKTKIRIARKTHTKVKQN